MYPVIDSNAWNMIPCSDILSQSRTHFSFVVYMFHNPHIEQYSAHDNACIKTNIIYVCYNNLSERELKGDSPCMIY